MCGDGEHNSVRNFPTGKGTVAQMLTMTLADPEEENLLSPRPSPERSCDETHVYLFRGAPWR